MSAADICDSRIVTNKFAPNREPDPDAIKMFVGQIPRHMSEDDVRKLFEEYGPVYQLNILRDPQTGESRSCCFVTFYTRRAALEAQNALHNLKTLPNMHHPIQMKPADTETKNQRKLFVGMISKSLDEKDVKNMFSSYGAIEECLILRDNAGKSRGCAFVTFERKQNALNAIKCLHHSQTMKGCSSPINIKFADTPKLKETKKIQQQLAASIPLLQQLAINTNITTPTFPQNNIQSNLNGILLLQKLLSNNSLTTQNSFITPPSNNSYHFLSNFSNPANQTSFFQCQNPILTPNFNSLSNSTSHLFSNNGASGDFTNILSEDFKSIVTNSSNALNNSSDVASNIYYQNYLNDPTKSITENMKSLSNSLSLQGDNKQIVGPDGCNLFIYHLPAEFNDLDLAQTFSPFGTVISAKVFIDKVTNLSKCFGFVSYDNAISAQNAIRSMNGFQIGSKRLKVQIKKTKEYSSITLTSNSCFRSINELTESRSKLINL